MGSPRTKVRGLRPNRAAQAAAAEFQAVKEKKDLLSGLSTWKYGRPARAKPDSPPAAGAEAHATHSTPTPLALSPSTSQTPR